MKTMANGKQNIGRNLVPNLVEVLLQPCSRDLSNIPQILYLSHDIKTIYSKPRCSEARLIYGRCAHYCAQPQCLSTLKIYFLLPTAHIRMLLPLLAQVSLSCPRVSKTKFIRRHYIISNAYLNKFQDHENQRNIFCVRI